MPLFHVFNWAPKVFGGFGKAPSFVVLSTLPLVSKAKVILRSVDAHAVLVCVCVFCV